MAADIRVRFAPSPTGHVHIGNIRVAIYNWLFARNQGGKMLLRIEDTDRERHTPEAVETLLEALEWLGIDYDEEPVYQSQRLERYREVCAQLLDGGHAYRSDKGDASKGEAVIFKVEPDAAYEDIILGPRSKEGKDMADFVIMKSDNTPVFHLANVVDDIDMRVSHILRGNDHVENTYRHVLMYQALGATPPLYAHFPMIVNASGKPYSKRDGDAYVGDFRSKGYLPEALFNFLALCGWSPGDDREYLPREELIKAFSLERVRSSPGQFDMQKLDWMNKEYLKAFTVDALIDCARPVMQGAGLDLDGLSPDKQEELIQLYRERITTINDLPAKAAFLLTDEYEYDEKAVRKFILKEGCREILESIVEIIETAASLDEAGLTAPFEQLMAEKELKFLKLAQPIRVAVSGGTVSPGIFETLAFLGRDETLARIRKTMERFYKES